MNSPLLRLGPSLFAQVILLMVSLPVMHADERRGPESATHFEDVIRPKLVTYCAACHEDNDSEGAVLFLDAESESDLSNARGSWASVAEQLRNRTMPPADEDQPSEEDRLLIANWIDDSLRNSACHDGPYAGAVTTRRLNRNEYDNTIRDLLQLDTDLAQRFPVDGSGGQGFDNNGETLFLPPVLMERYLEAATEAIGRTVIVPAQEIVRLPSSFRRLDGHSNEVPIGEELRLAPAETAQTSIRILEDGRYRLQLNLKSEQQFDGSTSADLTVALAVDGIAAENFRLKVSDVVKQRNGNHAGELSISTTIRLARGFHRLELSSVDQPIQLEKLTIQQQLPDYDQHKRARHKFLTGLKVGSRVNQPELSAQKALTRFARRAFRRPVSNQEVRPFVDLVLRSLDRGDPFEHALRQGLRAVLVSPHFLFRVETAATTAQPVPLSDHALATRLSYFLWSSMPDDRLFRLADSGQLSGDDLQALSAEVDRILNDEKAEAFFYQFTGQWLGTIEVGASVVPDTGKFKGQFNTELLMDFRDEPVRLFQYIVNEDRSLLELLNPDYAIVNTRLTQHYQLNGQAPLKIRGNGWSSDPERSSSDSFARLNLDDARRGGILGMGGVHLLTSYPNRTSPVLRGGWVLETLLGVRVPSPPPDVPELPTKKGSKKLTAKESLALHRKNPACSACHNLMDPVGFSLENYDVLGRWRDEENGQLIDTTARLPSGENFRGLQGLRDLIVQRQDEFLHHLASKLLGYALGRSLSDRDDCTIQQIVQTVKNDDLKARTLIREVVLSVPFRMHQKPDGQ